LLHLRLAIETRLIETAHRTVWLVSWSPQTSPPSWRASPEREPILRIVVDRLQIEPGVVFDIKRNELIRRSQSNPNSACTLSIQPILDAFVSSSFAISASGIAASFDS